MPSPPKRPEDAVLEALERSETRAQLLAWAGTLAPCADDAEDIVQEAMLKAWSRRATFRGTSRVTSWLYRIIVNVALGEIRRTAWRSVPHDHTPGPIAPSPEGQILARVEVTRIGQRFSSDPGWLPLVAVHQAGRRTVDVAWEMQLPVGTVKARMSRLRKNIVGAPAH